MLISPKFTRASSAFALTVSMAVSASILLATCAQPAHAAKPAKPFVNCEAFSADVADAYNVKHYFKLDLRSTKVDTKSQQFNALAVAEYLPDGLNPLEIHNKVYDACMKGQV